VAPSLGVPSVADAPARRTGAPKCTFVALLLAALIGGWAVRAQAEPGNLLAGKRPARSEGVTHAGRLTDGILSHEGDEWLTDLTSRLTSGTAFLEYDLGEAQAVRCVLVQADANEVGVLSGSLDGQTWQPLWQVGGGLGPGMRLRSTRLEATVRWLRLSATGADVFHGVAEIAVYSQCPEPWPPELLRQHGTPAGESIDRNILLFGLLAGLFVLLHRERGSKLQYLLLLPALAVGGKVVADLVELFDFSREPPLRAMVAGLAAIVLVKETFLSKRWAPHRAVTLTTLVLCAATALGSYYHFGMLQFGDHAKGRRTFVHTFDMRHYFPVAKYFRELRYDGLYLASLAAYMDNTPDFTEDQLGQARVRDLRTSEIRPARELAGELPGIRSRFTAVRWDEFKRDMKYFSEAMGRDDYLGSLADHGANATPAWILSAYLIFKNAPASELTLTLAGLIDPVLVLFFFLVLARTFGMRVMLYVMVIWGATDFYTFTANFMGSTLRQDWLVALGLGVCAIKRKRPGLGGALIAYSGLIRAFPAMAVLFLLVPLAWFAFDHLLSKKRLPSLAEWRASQRPALRACFGAAACVVTLVVLTSAMFGFGGSWMAWQEKIGHHATDPSTNNVGLRNVLAFDPDFSAERLIAKHQAAPDAEWVRTQRLTFADRSPLFYGILLVVTALALLACRGRSLEQVALMGLLLVPFYFYPSNYYCHFVFLLPLAVASPREEGDHSFVWGFIALAALCVGQFFTLRETWVDLRYTYQSFLLLVAFGAILARIAWQSLALAPLRPGAAAGDLSRAVAKARPAVRWRRR
jgi:hypothetical protein